jgi:hypothetical protein
VRQKRAQGDQGKEDGDSADGLEHTAVYRGKGAE